MHPGVDKKTKSENAKGKKIRIILGKRHHVQLEKRKELSHNIRYIGKVPIRIVMDVDYVRVHPEDSLVDLVGLLRGEETAALVVDEEDRLLGFITIKDFLKFFAPPEKSTVIGIGLLKRYSLTRASRVADIMVTKPLTVNINDKLEHAIRIMLETGKHHLPVVDDEKRVHGILEIKDIIRLIRIVSM